MPGRRDRNGNKPSVEFSSPLEEGPEGYVALTAAQTGDGSTLSDSSSRKSRSKSCSRPPRRHRDSPPRRGNSVLRYASESLFSIPNFITVKLVKSGLIKIRDETEALPSMAMAPYPSAQHDSVCLTHRKYPVLFKLEFQLGSKVTAHQTKAALKEANEEKNVNKRIIPYDYNRVILEPLPGQPDSDYINASYVDGINIPRAYIVAQGPSDETVGDFWRMVWQVRVCVIVMLTKPFDFIKTMCTQYWPLIKEKTMEFHGIKVELDKEEELASFQMRTLKVTRGSEVRLITQFHYTGWPCHTQPFVNAILEFRRRLKIYRQQKPPELKHVPELVHCSDGAGRSGTFLALDSNLHLHEEDERLDIYGYFKRLRNSRRGLIENVDQYRFVYDALEEHLKCGPSHFPVSALSHTLKRKSAKGADGKNEYQREFEIISKLVPHYTIGECAGGHRFDNRFKNRDVMSIPPDTFRPYLTSFQGTDFTDYINSVFVDGYTHPKEYVVTEWPLNSHLGDIWSVVYDFDCCAIVVLCNPSISTTYPSFWPEKQPSAKYGPVFTCEYLSHKYYDNIRSWVFRLHKKIIALNDLMQGIKSEPKTCQVFQLMCWPQGHKVPTSTNALVELMNMVEKWRMENNYGTVVVVSPDGMSRAGVYCAANACIEQVLQHREVDVFQAVRTVRRHRPQLVNNLTEYKYCYDVVLHYVLHFLQREMDEKIKG